MKTTRFWLPFLLLAAVFLEALPLRAADTVVIPRSRLEELERKEAELEKLKRELNRAETETRQLKDAKAKADAEKQRLEKARQEAEAKAASAAAAAATARAAAPAPAHVSPAMASLPPLQPGEVVDAMDLMNHYLADANTANARYGKQRLIVQGEIVALSKPAFQRAYLVHLRTADTTKRVTVRISPPEVFKSVFTVKNGLELVGVDDRDARTTLWRVGEKVRIEGKCKGLDAEGVDLGNGTIHLAP